MGIKSNKTDERILDEIFTILILSLQLKIYYNTKMDRRLKMRS